MAKGRVGRDTSPPAPTPATEAPPPPPAEQVPAVAAAPKALAPVKVRNLALSRVSIHCPDLLFPFLSFAGSGESKPLPWP